MSRHNLGIYEIGHVFKGHPVAVIVVKYTGPYPDWRAMVLSWLVRPSQHKNGPKKHGHN